MATNLIQIKRGLKANLPTLEDGELGWCEDTFELYCGQDGTNKLIGSADNMVPDGTTTGDIIRWNAVTEAWESCAEPFDIKQINLTPLAEAMENVEGGLYYKSGDKQIYVCTEDT